MGRDGDHVVTLADLVLFTTQSRTTSHTTAPSRVVLQQVWEGAITLLASLTDSYVVHIYGEVNDLGAGPRTLRAVAGNRRRAPVDAGVAWDVLEKARATCRATPETIVAVMNDQSHLLGVHEKTGGRYVDRASWITCHVLITSAWPHLSIDRSPGRFGFNWYVVFCFELSVSLRRAVHAGVRAGYDPMACAGSTSDRFCIGGRHSRSTCTLRSRQPFSRTR